MEWFFIALLPPALWGITNYFDKYLVSKYFKSGSVGALVIFSCLIGFILLPFVYLLQPSVIQINSLNALIIIAAAVIYILACIPYFYALNQDETSIVVALFQVIPVYAFILGYFFLGETLTSKQIGASLLILIGAIAIALNLEEKKIAFKKNIFWLMMLSSFLFAVHAFLFKFVAVQETFWTTSFWMFVGYSLVAVLILVLVKSYRVEFMKVIKVNKVKVLSLNGVNEIINIAAELLMAFATLLAPLALVWVVAGVQPFIVFLYGILLTIFLPHIAKESMLKRQLVQKFIAIIIMFVGLYFLI